jgi:hypothetical protein
VKTAILALLSFILPTSLTYAIERVNIDPGPENGGMRLRLSVTPKDGKDGYLASLEVLNVSDKDITVRAGWSQDTNKGGVKDYIEAAASIETWPPIAPWIGQILAGHRTEPQPEEVIKPGGTLGVSWQTDSRRLKNGVTDANAVQNPELALAGLYSVHATLVVKTATGDVLLRSNEQLVRSGGGGGTPKHSYGQLFGAEAAAKTATVGLGALHQVVVGDQWDVGHPYSGMWRVTITKVFPTYSTGTVEVTVAPREKSDYPKQGMPVTLFRAKAGG